MSRAALVLHNDIIRERAIRWIRSAPHDTRLTFQEPKRSLPQNDRLWAMLSDIASQKRYHGLKLTTNDWKLVFLDALERETRIVPNLDGTGFVNLRQSSSDLSKAEMTALIEIIFEWGARNDVVFHDAEERAA